MPAGPGLSLTQKPTKRDDAAQPLPRAIDSRGGRMDPHLGIEGIQPTACLGVSFGVMLNS